MRYPGEVWFLPPEARDEGDPKWRRHVLLNACDEVRDLGVLSFASSAGTEARFGGASYLLDPFAHASSDSGFRRPTYITPCRLVSAPSEDMQRKVGRVIDEMPQIRTALRRAIGVGTGTAVRGRAAGTLRGRIARLSPSLAAECEASAAIIITEPGYSLAQRYQLILPVVDADQYERIEDDVVASGQEWIAAADQNISSALVIPRHVQSAFQPIDLTAVLNATVDEGTMGAIDQSLVQLFGL